MKPTPKKPLAPLVLCRGPTASLTVVRSIERLRVGADMVLLPVDKRPAAVRHEKLPVAVLNGGEILQKGQALQLIGIADLLDAVGQHPGRKPVRLKAVFHRHHEAWRVRSFIILDPQRSQIGGIVLPGIAQHGQIFPHFGDVAFPGILIKDNTEQVTIWGIKVSSTRYFLSKILTEWTNLLLKLINLVRASCNL